MTDQPPAPASPPEPEMQQALPPVERRRGLSVRQTVLIVVGVVVIVGGIVIAALTLGKSAVGAFVANNTTTKYASNKFGYRVTLPGKPTITERTTPSGEPAERVEWDNHDGVVITVEAAKLSTTIPAAEATHLYGIALGDGIKAASATDPRDRKTFTIDGQLAESEVADSPSIGGEFYFSVVIVRNFIYTVVIAHPTKQLENSINHSLKFTN